MTGCQFNEYPGFLPTHIGPDDSNDKQHLQTSTRRPNPMTVVWVSTGIFATIGHYDRFQIASSVRLFTGVAMLLVLWVCSTETKLFLGRRSRYSLIVLGNHDSPRLYSAALYTSTALVIWWALISMDPRCDPLPILDGYGDKYFLAVNLHNNKAILPEIYRELTALAQYSENCVFREIFC